MSTEDLKHALSEARKGNLKPAFKLGLHEENPKNKHAHLYQLGKAWKWKFKKNLPLTPSSRGF